MRRIAFVLMVCVAALGQVARGASSPVIVLKSSAVHVGNGDIIADGMVIVRDGRLSAVGADLAVPPDAIVIDVAGSTITPGLIDANASVEPTNLMTAHRRDPSAILHDFFCPNHARKPVVGCCGSRCSRALFHVTGEKCKACGFPGGYADFADGHAGFAVGTDPRVSLAEQSAEVIPNTRVIDSVNLRSPDFDRLLRGGVTTVFVAPGSAAVISSQGAVVHTGGPVDKRILRETDAVKAVMGTDPSWRGGFNRPPLRGNVTFLARRPTTRMGVTWVFRKAMYDTLRHDRGLRVGGADAPSEEAMVVLDRVLKGDIPLRIQARTQQDITTALRLTEEFVLPFVLEEATEAYLCLDELKARQTPVIFGPIYIRAPGYRARSSEVSRARLHTMKALLDAGIETALTAQELRDEDGLARQAMYAIRCGVDPANVMRSVTQTPARLLGLDGQLGLLKKGRRGDLVVWSGRPFAATSRPVVVLIDGEVVLDRRKH